MLSVLKNGTVYSREIEIKRSRFLTTLFRTDTPAEAHEAIALVRSEHTQARHNCTAFRIWEEDHTPVQHSNDDGEPSGTAGKPMLEAIAYSSIWNVTAVVSRYFGGILLGAGGLIRAYSTSVSEALAHAPQAHLEERSVVETILEPSDAGRIESALRASGVSILSVAWDRDVTLRAAIIPQHFNILAAQLAQLSGGLAPLRMVHKTTIEVDGPGT